MYAATFLGGAAAAITGLIFFSFFLSYPAFLLWNGCLVGAIDGVNKVTWMQMWGISVLFIMLFKSYSVSKKD